MPVLCLAMSDANSSPPGHVHTPKRTKPHRLPILHMFRHRKSHSRSDERGPVQLSTSPESPKSTHARLPSNAGLRNGMSTTVLVDEYSNLSSKRGSQSTIHRLISPGLPPPSPARLPSIVGVYKDVPASVIADAYSSLHDCIDSHVLRFYQPKPKYSGATQAVIEHASTGAMIPWPQIRSFLSNPSTTLATLSLCIAWTILSRSLLLKLGVSSSSGSSFLPPEIVECFQSFSLGKGAMTLEPDEIDSVDFALLSRWKRISATLLHSTYVDNAFSNFDSRTVNIERALKDVDPLLSTYAVPDDAGRGKDARVSELRDVLRKGAKLAFTLFNQSSFWKFDWTSDRAVEHGKEESQRNLGRIPSFETGMACVSVLLTPKEVVIWPTLLRVMDGEGISIQGQADDGRNTFGEKQYLSDFVENRGKQ
ncbi:unnamed protein product [Periconia digitata]|uniref:Uncharacterized protein n=1 Tax=Periconia digitata TaxID=1303443 RepID=A0A9W4XP00_9PLEO|nr:unnamed protein product [Periconia digitata]